jgi:ParB family transcriptional regulator, chromosome partitioning protein
MAKAKPDAGAKTKRKSRKPAAEPASRGIAADHLCDGEPPKAVKDLQALIERDGGAVLGVFRDPLGGQWQFLAALPLELVEPTPFQRDLSPAHADRLGQKIGALDRFLDPIIAVRTPEGRYWTPNGLHRSVAMKTLGARSITALVIPEFEMAFKILALNTEKAHNLREKSLEVIRMARQLAELDPRSEQDFAVEFEEPAFLTLGLCYEGRPRYSGGPYQPVLKRVEQFLAAKLPAALETREARRDKLFELDDAVAKAVAELKERGFESPYLKAFVVARLNPLRFRRGATAEFDETIEAMLSASKKFDASKVKADQVSAASGPPDE